MEKNDYPEILQELRSSIVNSLIKQGIELEKANLAAHDVVELVRINWGGMQIYICKGLGFILSDRDVKIWNEFDGRNHHELIRKYDISLQWLYKIIKHQRKIEMQKKQDDVFD